MKPSYHTASIRELKKLFASLPVPEQAMRDGFFRASFIGPAWYRISGFPSVHVAGLPYWQGKKFLTPVSATNILRKNNDFVEALVMTVEEGISMIDGKLGVALRCVTVQKPLFLGAGCGMRFVLLMTAHYSVLPLSISQYFAIFVFPSYWYVSHD